ncbi:MAG: FISUMP domain-containing protein [Patescibacteria group bacterium]
MFKHKSKFAFTLIELLVVIAIIGLLATVSVIALNNARSKSRDAKRVSEIKQIQTALELYYNDQNRYPLTAEFISGAEIFSTSSYGTTTYLAHIPSTPTPADGACSDSENLFTYTSNDGSSYSLTFCLGVNTGTLTAGVNNANPYGITYLNPGSEDAGCPVCEATSTPEECEVGCSCSDANLVCCEGCDEDAVCQGGTYCGQTINCPVGQSCFNGACISFTCGNSQVAVTSIGNYTCGAGDLCVYDTVEIGTQCWLKQSMNIGSKVTGVTTQSDNSILEKYCYNNSDANCTAYGALYQWNETMQYSVVESSQGICPAGWHVPSDTDLSILESYLTDSPNTCSASRSSVWSCANAGNKLREAGTFHWSDPNTGATNSSGFSALAASARLADGSFSGLGANSYLWSSSVIDGSNAWRRTMGTVSTVYRAPIGRSIGLSVRCLKN